MIVVRRPAASIDGFMFSELEGSPKITTSLSGENQIVRNFKLPWEDWKPFASAMRGRSYYQGIVLVIQDPHVDPQAPAFSVDQVDVVPFGGMTGDEYGNGKWAKYSFAEVVVTYRRRVFNVNDPSSPDVTETLEPTYQFLTVPNTNLFWDDSQNEPLEPGDSPGLVVRMMNWRVRFANVGLPLPEEFFGDMGCCNNAGVKAYRLRDQFFGDEELLYDSPIIEILGTPGSDFDAPETGSNVNLTLSFTWNVNGWNNFPKAGEGFAPIYLEDGSQYKPYEPVSFNLFGAR